MSLVDDVEGLKQAALAELKAAADLAQSGFASEIERNMRRLPAALAPTAPASADGACRSGEVAKEDGPNACASRRTPLTSMC